MNSLSENELSCYLLLLASSSSFFLFLLFSSYVTSESKPGTATGACADRIVQFQLDLSVAGCYEGVYITFKSLVLVGLMQKIEVSHMD